MTKEVLHAKLTAVIGLVHTLTGFQALLPKSDVVLPLLATPFSFWAFNQFLWLIWFVCRVLHSCARKVSGLRRTLPHGNFPNGLPFRSY